MPKKVELSWRELNILYNVDFLSVAQLAERYGIEWSDMKQALRNYGFTIRKNEPAPRIAEKPYEIVLVDSDKIVKKEAPVVSV